jgi:glycylpeptide N-tetradecanoyltransferase
MKGSRVMNDKDVRRVTQLLNQYLKSFVVAPEFSEEEVRHWFLPRENVMYSYVVEVSLII